MLLKTTYSKHHWLRSKDTQDSADSAALLSSSKLLRGQTVIIIWFLFFELQTAVLGVSFVLQQGLVAKCKQGSNHNHSQIVGGQQQCTPRPTG